MLTSSIDFSSIKNDIRALLDPPPKASLTSFFAYFWKQDPSQALVSKLERLSLDLKTKVALTTNYARKTQDQKIKYTACQQILQMNSLLQNESKQGVFQQIIKEHPSARQTIDAMISTVNNALVRGNDKQEVWGTRFCPEEALLDAQWEGFMRTTRLRPIDPVGWFKYYVLFAVSLIWTQLLSITTSRNWRDKILTTGPYQANLYLGALPLITPLRNDLNDLQKMGIKAILSVVEPFENNTMGWISSPITPEQWEEAGIKQLQIPLEDFFGGTISEIEGGVEFIRWNVINDRSIYIHCKAGRGRSALILLAYLIKYEDLSTDEALARMQLTRPHAGFEESSIKMQTLREYEKRVRYL